MKTATGLIGRPAELSTGVELGEHQLHAAQARARFDVHGDSPATVSDLNRPVRVDVDVDSGPETGNSLVHRVVDDFPQAVHEASRVSRPDIHSWALAHRLETLQDRQVSRGIITRRGHAHSFSDRELSIA